MLPLFLILKGVIYFSFIPLVLSTLLIFPNSDVSALWLFSAVLGPRLQISFHLVSLVFFLFLKEEA